MNEGKEMHASHTIFTPRLMLRRWAPEDAEALERVVSANIEHLSVWLPWARRDALTIEARRDLLASFRDRFDAGKELLYGIWSRDAAELLGGAGLHPHKARPVEIGYWLARDAQGLGYATEAADALRQVASASLGAQIVEIRCQPENRRSASIPARLGFVLHGVEAGTGIAADGSPCDLEVWRWEPVRSFEEI